MPAPSGGSSATPPPIDASAAREELMTAMSTADPARIVDSAAALSEAKRSANEAWLKRLGRGSWVIVVIASVIGVIVAIYQSDAPAAGRRIDTSVDHAQEAVEDIRK